MIDGPLADTIPLGLYLWLRIRQCGIGKVFGVPGDFNLALLDYIYEVEDLDWVGSTNELNAAYATDGYARVKGGAGCFVTTHGVGELSAINGVAGSMTEQVKVIHIVGQSARNMQQEKLMIHHNIGHKPDHQMFNRAADGFRCSSATLMSEETAAEEIDRVLRDCFIESKPVTIHVPMDMITVQIETSRLDTPIDLTPFINVDMLEAATDAILEAIYNAKRPGILVDYLTKQHSAVTELHTLLDRLHIPVFSTVMGKAIVDESHECFVGLYNGAASSTQTREAFEACDLMIVTGDMPSDSNTGGYTRKLDAASTIYINPSEVLTVSKSFANVPIRAVLANMARELDSARILGIDIPIMQSSSMVDSISERITQSWIWPRLAKFFRPGDVILGETGTASFGLPLTTFPSQVQWITQAYYGSIGYATPAAFGAAMALQDLAPTQCNPPRTILVTGDGSLMLTVQEIGNMIKHGAAPVIFVINNAGYTIERAIHGAHKSYNDIVPFDYSCMLQFLGMPAEQALASFHRAATRSELDAVLNVDCVCKPKGTQIVEVIMDKLDIPWALAQQLVMRGPDVQRTMQESGFAV